MTRSERKIIGQCEACKVDLHAAGEASWETADYLDLPLAPSVTALCCAKSSRAPKGSCARLIRQRRNLCPGCGEYRSHAGPAADMGWRGVLCEKCQSALARQAAAEKQEIKLYRLLASDLFPYISASDSASEAAQHLARAVAGPRRRWVDATDRERFGTLPYASENVPLEARSMHSGSASDPVVEMTAEQAVSLDAFVKLVFAALKEQREQGFKEGDDLLRRMSRGDVKPVDYEQWTAKRNGDGR